MKFESKLKKKFQKNVFKMTQALKVFNLPSELEVL